VEGYDKDRLITFIQLALRRKNIKFFHREKVNGHQFLRPTREKLLANPYKFPGGPTGDLPELIVELNKQNRFVLS